MQLKKQKLVTLGDDPLHPVLRSWPITTVNEIGFVKFDYIKQNRFIKSL